MQKKETDTGTWEIWIDTSKLGASAYFARIEVYQITGGRMFRISFADSPRFAPSAR